MPAKEIKVPSELQSMSNEGKLSALLPDLHPLPTNNKATYAASVSISLLADVKTKRSQSRAMPRGPSQ